MEKGTWLMPIKDVWIFQEECLFPQLDIQAVYSMKVSFKRVVIPDNNNHDVLF